MGYSIWLAFHKWDLLSAPRFVGFENIVKMFQDPVANLALYNSAFYTIFAVPIQLVISFSLALALIAETKISRFLSCRILPTDYRAIGSQRGRLAACISF